MKSQVDLYKLPKDIIVKLFLTLQDDIKEEYEELFQDIVEEVNNIAPYDDVYMWKCFKRGCTTYDIVSRYGDVLETCDECMYSACKDHLEESGIEKYIYESNLRKFTLCSKCKEAHIRITHYEEGMNKKKVMCDK